MKKQLQLFYPVLFAIFPTLSLYTHNLGQAWPSIILTPLIYSLLFAFVSWLGLLVILKNKKKASIMTSIWLLLFFSYGHVFLYLAEQGIFTLLPIGPNLILLTVYGLLLLGAFFWLWKGTVVKPAQDFFIIVGLVLVGMSLWQIVPFEVKRYQALQDLREYKKEQQTPLKTSNDKDEIQPDIYYLVFDRYARADVLAEYFEFDNSQFITNLESEGFYVASKSAANYPATFQSLASSLNMTHLRFLPEVLGHDYTDKTVVYQELLHNNRVVGFLQDQGYSYIHIGDSWEPTRQNKQANLNVNKFIGFNEFTLFLYDNTLFNVVLGKINDRQVFTGTERLNVVVENLNPRITAIKNQTKENAGPTFVFGHFLMPHPPFLFNQDCNKIPFKEVRQRSQEEGYLDQVSCTNKLITNLVKTIKNGQRPAIIIIQSDEGPFLPQQYFNDGVYIRGNKESYNIHSKIINAIYLPETEDYAQFGWYDSITPINTFGLIFNHYFGTDLDLKEDNIYIFKDNDYPYSFTEITDVVD